jgi:ADP-ribose pyrophosphatase
MCKTKILETKKLTNERWLNLYLSKFEKDGKEGSWIFASRKRDENNNVIKGANAVVIVPVLRTTEGSLPSEVDRLVVIKEYRVPIQDYEYHFPAGLINPGEDVVEAAKRELKEETGYSVTKVLYQSPLLTSSAGMSDECSVMVVVECVEEGDQDLEHSEEIEVILCSSNEALDLAMDNTKLVAKGSWPFLLLFGGCKL